MSMDLKARAVPRMPASGSDRATPVPSSRDPLMTVKELAIYLHCSKSFLDKARLTGDGPAFSRLGRKILYRKSVVDAWLQQRQFASTSQYEIK